ncbi:endonuclease-reverse transcriptase [Elysia marginata]|uniref:Endonuclease-reverse transcriptase n=1 Tax=Elysia marginata TaxID=1093978 RepID=A0AAV4IY21_9GAST|nr:endonuclease-reverse transcriptase [Elysia marginata]
MPQPDYHSNHALNTLKRIWHVQMNTLKRNQSRFASTFALIQEIKLLSSATKNLFKTSIFLNFIPNHGTLLQNFRCRNDNIPAEIIKNSREMGIKALHHLCCQIWKQQEWPEDWKLHEFVMLYKDGNSKEWQLQNNCPYQSCQ